MKTTPMMVGSLAIVSVLVGTIDVQAALTPTETVKDTVVTVMGILNNPLYQEPGMSDARRTALETVIREAVDYREMARRTLGVTWNSLPDAERQRFCALFLQVLRDGVASRMSSYSGTTVIYLGEQTDGHFAEVRTLFQRDKENTAIDLRLVNESGRWVMYDAVIDGVRLVENYRSQFVYVMKAAAYGELIRRIEAMTLLPKTFEWTNAP